MRRWNLPQVNTKVMCAVLTAAMVMTGFTACGGTTSAGTESVASESAEQKETIAPESTTESAESGEEKVESYLGQITAIDGNVISIALAEKPEAPKLLPVRHPAEKSQMARPLMVTVAHPTEKHRTVRLLMATVAHPTEKLPTVRNPRKTCWMR